MSDGQGDAREAQWLKWRSVAELYHAYFTGLILTVVTRRGTADAAEFVFRVFRRQQQERFLPGLKKLGLSDLPPAVAAAQYHYLSNWIGGVHVEYMYESDAKAWIRYPPPRWIWKGTAICGVPGEVSRAMLRGWHANNGVALGDIRLGFVCTKQSVDGQDGRGGASEFAAFLNALFVAQDDVAETMKSEGAFEIRQQSWKLMDGVADYHRACAKVLEGLFEGLAAGCGRHIGVHMHPAAGGRPPLVWTIE